MRIAVFHNVPPGGAKRVILEELKFFRNSGYTCDLYSYGHPKDYFFDIEKYATNTYEYKLDIGKRKHGLERFTTDLKHFKVLPAVSKKIANDVDAGNYDVFLVHPDINTQAPYVLRFSHTPTIYFCQELLRNAYEKELGVDTSLPTANYIYERMLRSLRKHVDRINARSATQIATASNYIKRKVKIAYNRQAKVVPLGVDTDIFKPVNKKPDLITFVGDEEAVSGYYFTEEILRSKILKGKIKLQIINRKNNKLRLDDRELAKKLGESLAVLCTSHSEPFGLTSIEAMASGTPVLAVNEGGYRETVVNGKTGYLLPRNPDVFAKKIDFLSKNRYVYDKMREECVAYVKKNWTWEKHGAKLSELVKELVIKK